MPEVTKWVCTDDSSHVFDEDTEDHYCPLDPPYHGFLIETKGPSGPEPEPELNLGKKEIVKPPPPPQPSWPEVGLCVILMDASSSMTDLAFKGSPLTRMNLVATNAAGGIFDLERMQNNPNAFVAAFKFDDRVELMFVDTISNLLMRFDKDVRKFANYIYDELFKMQRGTDINKALQYAYDFIDKFLKRQLQGLPVKNYIPMKQRILKFGSVESVSIPNIRVLIYTDGKQYDIREDRTLRPNPFKENPLPDLNHDILIGAFFGQETDEGCKELKGLLSKCPRHDVLQFFLFDNAKQMSNLKHLFRMASGASGFCPKCLEIQLSK